MVQTRRGAVAVPLEAPPQNAPASRRGPAQAADKRAILSRNVPSPTTVSRRKRRRTLSNDEQAASHVVKRRAAGTPRVKPMSLAQDDKEAKEAPPSDSTFYDNIRRGVNRPSKPKSPNLSVDLGTGPDDQLQAEDLANQASEDYTLRTKKADGRKSKATQARKNTFYEAAEINPLGSSWLDELAASASDEAAQPGSFSDDEAAAAAAEESLFIGEEDNENVETEAAAEQGEDLGLGYDGDGNAEQHDENICKVDRIAPYMKYLAPERAGKRALTTTAYLNGVNAIIRDVGRRGWILESGDWTNEVLPAPGQTEKEWTMEHAKKLKGKHEMALFKAALALFHFCESVPKWPDTAGQSNVLREPESSQSLQTILRALDTSFKAVRDGLQDLNRNWNPHDRASSREQSFAFQALYKRIIPMLVVALKRACLLGGSACVTRKDLEFIENEQGTFTVATLQLGLRIVYYIVELHKQIEQRLQLTGLPPSASPGPLVAYKRRLRLGTLARDIQNSLLKGMRKLRDLADAPGRSRERQVRYAAQQMEIRRVEEENDKQMALFVQSTFSQDYSKQHMTDHYFEKHGWHLWEDEKLLGVIRVVSSPDVYVLARRVPTRNVTEVAQRVADLKGMMKTRYELVGKIPPKWCYS